MKKSTLLLTLLLGGALSAAVPNRITYQGRLFKSGVAVSGSKSIRLALVHPSTFVELESEVFNVTLPATGEFTIVWDATLDPGFDWRGVNPQLKISVDGEALSPNELLGVSPYSFVARKVDVGGVDTAALADGAVTNTKVAVGVEAAKILVSTSPGNTYLSDWRHPVSKDKIDASKIEGTIPTIPSAHGASHAGGGSDALANLSRTQVAGTALVANSTFTQVLQAVSVSTAALALKGLAGSASKIIQIYDSGVLGNTGSVPQEQAWFDKDANLVTNKGITAGSGGFTSLTATTGTVSLMSVATMTATGASTFNRITASSVTVAGPLNVTGATALGNYTAASGTITNLTAGSANITGTASAHSLVVTNTISGTVLAAPYPTMIVIDEKALGTAGGGFDNGAWRVRTLNTVLRNTITGASLSSDTVTLPAGTYRVYWRAPCFRVNRNKTIWRNTTDSVDVIQSGNLYANSDVNFVVDSVGESVFDIPTSKSFQIWHRCQTTIATNGFGLESNMGTSEIYTQVFIEKIR